VTRSRSEDDLAWLGVAGLHEKLQKGEYTATDVTGFFLDRIDRFDPELQSYASTWPERALRSAARLDRLKDQGLPLGPLHGVPIALKDLCDVAGECTFAGTTVLGSSPAPANAEVVAKAWRSRQAFSRRLEGCFETVDVLAAPVIPTLFAANTNLADLEATPEASSAIRFVSPFNLSGSPSLTLPCGFDREDAPIGFQLIGRHLEESRLLTLGSAYQTSTDWHRRRPGL
jgi:Asp-tRNA(Asn)/Glu-tRNA(Gln) amidotransferase A subunit family amidase